MIYIAHRGLFQGPDTSLENTPAQVELALSKGYDAEIDVWYVDYINAWALGHNAPTYQVSENWLKQHGLWLHAKNIDAMYKLSVIGNMSFFWHQSDDVTLTSNGYLWTYVGKPLTKRSIMLMPELDDPTLENTKKVNCTGICSDWVEKIQSLRFKDSYSK